MQCACPARSSSASSTRTVEGVARHGIYSGSKINVVLPVVLRLPRENATTIVQPGDVGFLTVEKGSG